tara:strand:+ start:1441 stop:4152 length:2712 start_codon:yes stop_codon:yes gene_type:complete
LSHHQSSSKVAGRLAVFSTLAAGCALLLEYILMSETELSYFGFVAFFVFAGLCLWVSFYLFAKKYQSGWFDEVTAKNKELQLQALFSTLNPWPVLRFDRYGQLISKNSCAKTYFYTLQYGADGLRSVYDFFPELTKEQWQSIVQESTPFELEYNRSGFWLCFYFRSHSQLGVINVYGYDVTAYKRQEQKTLQMQKNTTAVSFKTSQLLNDIFYSIQQPVKQLKLHLEENPELLTSVLGHDLKVAYGFLRQLEHIHELEPSRFKMNTHSFDCRFMFERLMTETAKSVYFQSTEIIVDADFGRHDYIHTDGRQLQLALEALLSFAIKRSQHKKVVVKARWNNDLTNPHAISGQQTQFDEKMFFRISVHDSGTADDRIIHLFNEVENLKRDPSDYVDLNLRFLMTLLPLVGGKAEAFVSPVGGYEIRIDWPVEPVRDHLAPDMSQTLEDFQIYVHDNEGLVAETTAKTLTRMGASVEYGCNQAALMKGIQAGVPNMVVYGLGIGEKADADVFASIRSAIGHPVPICLLVNQGEDIASQEFDDLDIDSIVLKPIRSRLLAQGIEHAAVMHKTKLAGPVAAEETPEVDKKEALTSEPQKVGQGHRPVILVVDDDIVVLHLVTDLLVGIGADVEIAESGPDALSVLDRTSIDLVIMDVRMPFMDGFETAQEIRAIYSNEIPVIALTASDDLADRTKALQVGMNDYLVKPVDEATLQERLSHWVTMPQGEEHDPGEVLVSIDEKTPLIQVREALRLLSRDHVLFTRSVLRFYGRFFIEGYTISTLLEANDNAELLVRLHSLRGGAASIGAYLLRDRVFDLENILRSNGLTDETKQAVRSLLVLLECVLYEAKVLLDYFTNKSQNLSPEDHLQEAVIEVDRQFNMINESLQGMDEVLKSHHASTGGGRKTS